MSNRATTVGSHRSVTDANTANGPPASPLASVSRAFRWAGVARPSTRTSWVPWPRWTAAGNVPGRATPRPSSFTSPYAPLSMIHVYTPRHPPCVGGASKLHGHPQSQLHSPRRDPDIRHFETILGNEPCGNGPQTIKDAAISRLERPPKGRLRKDYGSRVVVEPTSPPAGVTPEAASAAAARVIRIARATEPSMRTAATKNGIPGRVAGAFALMNQAKTSVNRIGPRTPVRPAMLALAPCNCPCSDGRTRRVMRLCNAGWTKPIGANTTIARRKTSGVGARPHTTNAAAPAIRPVISAFRSPKRLMNRFTRPPWTVMFNAPTTASDTPTSTGPHPYR